jgi:hypothetical protein
MQMMLLLLLGLEMLGEWEVEEKVIRVPIMKREQLDSVNKKASH